MESSKVLKASVGEKKPLKKTGITAENRPEKPEKATDKYQNDHKQFANKSYNQTLEKTKLEEHEFT